MEENQIDYEVSIIYAIPGQTVESFIDTIEFLIEQGCRNIKAYPLRIPKNSILECRKEDFKVKESKNSMNIPSVISSNSFSSEQREDMDRIVNRLHDGALYNHMESQKVLEGGTTMTLCSISNYLHEIKSVDIKEANDELANRVKLDYLEPIEKTIIKENPLQGMSFCLDFDIFVDQMQYIDNLLKKEVLLKLKKRSIPPEEESPFNKSF
ncbi:MAG: hypothetical protein IPH20_14325 [Bacteroidales bacterium]|nr:hypothetical protein [Bacteroidales bacterium]